MLVFLILQACLQAPEPTTNLAQIIAAPGLGPTSDFGRCRALPPKDVGQCSEFVAIHHAKVGKLVPGVLCPEVTTEPWRSECFFEEAERARTSGRDALAIELCTKSGDFADHCHLHLWSRDARAVLGQRKPDELGPRLGRLGEIHDRWAPHAEATFSHRFWTYVWNHAHRSADPLTLAACTSFQGPHRARCEDGAIAQFGQRLEARAASPRGHKDLCGLEPATLAQLGATMPGMRTVDPPDRGPLQTTLDAAIVATCRPSPGSP
jgi:hypothetical protein